MAGFNLDNTTNETNRTRTVRRVAPFAGVALAALLTLPLPSVEEHPETTMAAIALTLVMALCGLLLPWSLLPAPARMVLPLLFYVDVALLRHAEGGSQSGFGPLTLLPVVWLALYGSRRQLTAALGVMGATLIGPILLVGGDAYPVSEWRKATLYLMIGPMIGFVIQHLVEKTRKRADDLELQARSMKIVASAMRELPTDSDVRRRICEAVVEIGNADFCILMEPDEERGLVSSAQVGHEMDQIVLSSSDETSGAIHAFRSGDRRFVTDAASDACVPRRLVEATGAASVLFEPVLLGDECVGVLCVAWCTQVRSLKSSAVEGLGLLAAEAGVAMERGDLLHRATELARTDPLTGLANRRSWDEALWLEQERARRTGVPLCVALLDLDHFKAYNDRLGHQAGDLLLKEAAAAWRAQLREVDTLARWGGEEFALLLPVCSLEQAAKVIERVRSSTPGAITFSAGVAAWDEQESALHLMQRADSHLYAAKQNGRDRVSMTSAGSSAQPTTVPGSTASGAGVRCSAL
ncbi:MAG: sensor domain-containing diguanylate cyclase [Actinomycetota bacterium]|nr:sensor domain-containing diguanylate cyclase [Actinomycetota bacterium]